MGFRVSWIARSGSSTTELIELADRNPTGERHDFPDIGWYILEMPDDGQSPWVLLIADGTDHFADLTSEDAQALSENGNETLYFSCSDTVMSTVLVCFRNGVESWSVDYNCETATKEPELRGNLPPVAHEILAQLAAKQQSDDGADYIYDLTAELGRSLVGFRHDQDIKLADPEPFQVLGERLTRRPWWQFWR